MNDKPNEPEPQQNDDSERPLPASVKCKLAFLLLKTVYRDDLYSTPGFVSLYRRRLSYLIRRSERGQKNSNESCE